MNPILPNSNNKAVTANDSVSKRPTERSSSEAASATNRRGPPDVVVNIKTGSVDSSGVYRPPVIERGTDPQVDRTNYKSPDQRGNPAVPVGKKTVSDKEARLYGIKAEETKGSNPFKDLHTVEGWNEAFLKSGGSIGPKEGSPYYAARYNGQTIHDANGNFMQAKFLGNEVKIGFTTYALRRQDAVDGGTVFTYVKKGSS